MLSNERQQQLSAIGMHSRLVLNTSQPQSHQMVQQSHEAQSHQILQQSHRPQSHEMIQRSQSHEPPFKVIAVPGYDTQETVTLTYRLGIDHYSFIIHVINKILIF